jgi:outer membrane protein TolC
LEAFVKKNVVTAAALVLASSLSPALAQTPAAPPAPAGQTPVAPVAAGTQTQPTPPFHTTGPRVDLSIEEAVARAREKNIDIGVARITPRLSDFSLAALEASYRPNVTSSVLNRSNTTAVTNQTQGGGTSSSLHTGTLSWQGGMAQNMKWHGGSWNLGWTNSRVDSSNLFATRNPTYNSGLTASVTQPLLRGWRIDATRASLQTTRISQTNDEISLQTTTQNTVANVRNAYWDLVYAIQAVEAAQNSLDISNKFVSDNRARVEIGTLAPLDVRTSEAEAANRRLTLVQAQATVRTSELALKRLIVSGTDDPLWTSSLNPTDRPPATPEPLNVDAAIARALRERTDLQQSKNNLRISDINLRNQVESTRPQLDLIATYGLTGIGGTQFNRSGLGGTVISTIPSNYLDALATLGKFDLPAWTLQANFAVPLGVSAAEANVARSKLSLEQSQANLKSLELQIATDVQNAALTVQSSLESVQAAQVARQLAQEKLNATQSKLEVGMSTNYEVVQAQRDFADAQNNELRAVLNYRKALVNFETVQTVGTRGVGATVGSGAGGTGTTTTNTGGGTTGGGTGGTGGGQGGGGGL